MASSTHYLPGTKGGTADSGTAWINEEWANEIDMPAIEEMTFANKIMELNKLYGRMHYPRHDALSRASLGDTSENASALTFVANTETELTFTPATTVIPTQVSDPQIARMRQDPLDVLRRSMELGLAEGVDVSALSLVSSLTTNVAGDNGLPISKGDILDADMQVSRGAKQFYKAGMGGGICIVGVTQKDDLLNISDITNAQFRGDDANPAVSGWVAKAFGIRFYETGNVATTPGSTLWNVLFVPRAFVISYNQRPTVKAPQDFQLVKRLIGWTDFGYGTLRDAYACPIKTTTAL